MVPLHISHHTFHMQPHLPVFYEVKCITNVHIPLYDIISSFIIRIPFKSKTNNKIILLQKHLNISVSLHKPPNIHLP